MKIIVAEHAGFCFGVKRAIRIAEEAVQKQRVVCWGPLIHNCQEINRLEKLGVKTWSDGQQPAQADGDEAVLIRTHGVGPAVIKQLEEEGRQVIDATCTHVRNAQTLARQAREEGYQVIILGDKNHAEVRALREWTGNTALVVSSRHDLEGLKSLEGLELPGKVAVLAQTTEKEARFNELVQYLQEKAAEVRVLPTICAATQLRQNAALELARRVDMMIVVGGRHSSNTNKLWEVCREVNPESYLIEEAGELNLNWLKDKNTIGITAGASTPAWIIKEVIQKMEDYLDETKERLEEAGQETTKEEQKTEQEPVMISQEPETSVQEPEINEQESEAGAQEPEQTPQEPATDLPQQDEAPPAEESPAPVDESVPGEAKSVEEHDHAMQTKEQGMHDQLDIRSFRPGDLVKGTVVKVTSDEVLVDIGGKSEGIIPADQFSYRRVDPREQVAPGQEIMVEVIKEDKEGNILLSYKKARLEEAFVQLEEAKETGKVITAPVIQVVKGGMLVDVGIRGFVPASQVERSFVEDLNQYLNRELRLKVVELDRKNRKAVLSQRAVLEEEYRQQREALWNELQEGQTRRGTVRRLAAFGAFVDIGGIDGLLHVSEMGWGRVNKPSDVVSEGDEIEVYVLKADRAKEKVSLSLKGILPDPWADIPEKYHAGMVIEGKVARIAPFGAFIELEPGIDGLAHISQLSTKRVNKVEDVLSVGQQVTVKITEVDPDKKRISLSLKDVITDAEKKEYETFIEQQGQDSGATIGEMVNENTEQ